MLGTVYPLCYCGEPKHVGGNCSEMNKFGDMMVHLAKKNPRFRQAVAVDRRFGIFLRAWCIAELVQAWCLGMPQNLKLCDPIVSLSVG